MLKRSKYGVRMDKAGREARTVDGILFHSRKEAKHYVDLKLLAKAGKIKNLRLQPKWPLLVNGKLIGHYVADFSYLDQKFEPVIVDVKGVRTAFYIWKKKHFEAEYGMKITEI